MATIVLCWISGAASRRKFIPTWYVARNQSPGGGSRKVSLPTLCLFNQSYMMTEDWALLDVITICEDTDRCCYTPAYQLVDRGLDQTWQGGICCTRETSCVTFICYTRMWERGLCMSHIVCTYRNCVYIYSVPSLHSCPFPRYAGGWVLCVR